MTQLQTDLLAFCLENESDMGNPVITWNGNDYVCLPNTLNASIQSNKVGYNPYGDFRFRVRLNQFTDGIYPDRKQFITYQGDKLQIKQVKKPAHGVFYIYITERPNGTA